MFLSLARKIDFATVGLSTEHFW